MPTEVSRVKRVVRAARELKDMQSVYTLLSPRFAVSDASRRTYYCIAYIAFSIQVFLAVVSNMRGSEFLEIVTAWDVYAMLAYFAVLTVLPIFFVRIAAKMRTYDAGQKRQYLIFNIM